MSDLQEVTFSELLQRPKETVQKLNASRRHALRLLRRGSEEDLVLKTVQRAEEDHQVLELTIRVLRAVLADPLIRSQLLQEMLPQVFPWSVFLPPDDQAVFAQELASVLDGSAELGVPEPMLRFVSGWKNAAQIHVDSWAASRADGGHPKAID